MPILHLLIYSFTLWLGLYLLERDAKKLGLRYAGMGLISYALTLALALFLPDCSQCLRLPVMLPSLFWLGAMFHLLPDVPISENEKLVTRLAYPYALVAFLAGFFDERIASWMSLALPLIFLLGMALRWKQVRQTKVSRPPLLILVTAALFFALSSSLVLVPQTWLGQDWAILAMSVDLLLLGYVVAVLDAYDEGVSLKRDALRSFLAASITLSVVLGQVVVVMAIVGTTQALLLLSFGMSTSLLIGIIFYDKLQGILDSLVLQEATSHERESLRAASSALIRRAENQPLAQIEALEFSRLTRRALSHYADLNKLAASPLMELACLEDTESILERANALKALLRESVERLKPDSEVEFAPQDEWRFYNVLHFPYIRGLKPYSSRSYKEDLSKIEQEALEWFRVYVPERTLYNWQNSAAELIAQQLWELRLRN